MSNIFTEKRVRYFAVITAEIFTLITAVMTVSNGNYADLPAVLATFALIFVPFIAEKILKCKISAAAYVFFVLYSLGPMLGDVYKLYYSTVWWDKALHAFGGIAFAWLGIYLLTLINKNGNSFVTEAVFAFCFSVAIAALWEFFEFTGDSLFGMDMQHDTVINAINSYLFGDSVGTVGSIENITEVTVNGIPLPITGYIDIGLIDSMTDMLWETAGALVIAAAHLFDRGKHPAFKAHNLR